MYTYIRAPLYINFPSANEQHVCRFNVRQDILKSSLVMSSCAAATMPVFHTAPSTSPIDGVIQILWLLATGNNLSTP